MFDRESWRRHQRWALRCAVVTGIAAAAYAFACFRAARLVGGSSLPGLGCGVAAGGLIVYECLFVLRNWKGPGALRHRNPADVRLRRHIWLGLLSVPLVVLHSALFTRGSGLAVALLVVFLLVIASGIWGLGMQQWLPRKLFHDIPDETIAALIPDLTDQLYRESELLVLATCGPAGAALAAHAAPAADHGGAVLRRNIDLVWAERAGRGTGLLSGVPAEPVPDTERLRDYYETAIAPFLREGAAGRSRLRTRERAAEEFRDLKGKVNPAAHPVLDVLEELCERRRQHDRQARLHFWLHNWLWCVHLPLSASLVLLLLGHVLTAILYW